MQRLRALITVFWAFVFVVLTLVPGSAQTSLEKLFDFTASVESLAEAAESDAVLPVGRHVLLTGTLRAVDASEDGTYSVRVELAAGQWQGTSRVVLRTVFVDYSGETFRSLFDRESTAFLRLGSTVLAVARIAGVRTGEDGIRRVVLEGLHLRRLDS